MTLRESYERYYAQYCASVVERNSHLDALLRGAFAAGIQHALCFAKLPAAQITAELQRTSEEIDELWERSDQ